MQPAMSSLYASSPLANSFLAPMPLTVSTESCRPWTATFLCPGRTCCAKTTVSLARTSLCAFVGMPGRGQISFSAPPLTYCGVRRYDFVPGRLLKDPCLPGLDPVERASVYETMADALAALHAVDLDAAGLSNFGPPSDFIPRRACNAMHAVYESGAMLCSCFLCLVWLSILSPV